MLLLHTWPAGHSSHNSVLSFQNVPGWHVVFKMPLPQSDTHVSEPAADRIPGEHSVHVVDPFSGAYLFGSHDLHGDEDPDISWYCPLSHSRHAAVELVVASVPGGQSRHLVKGVAFEYVPGLQGIQESMPEALAKKPGAHSVQEGAAFAS